METTPSTVAPVRYWGENADVEALYSYPGQTSTSKDQLNAGLVP